MPARKPRDWTVEDLARQADAAADLIEYLRSVDEDDDDLVQDMVEGETEFLEVIDRALEQIADAEMMAAALKEREAGLAQRRKRFEDRAGFLRHSIEMAMAKANGDADLPMTLITPGATVTLREGKPKVIVSDESALPAEFWQQAAPTIDRTALNAVVKAGEIPPGVELSDPGFSLAVRRK